MKILLIQLKQIGDVLMTTPAVRAIKKRYPQAKVHFLTYPPSDEIFQKCSYVDKIWTMDKKASWIKSLNNIIKIRSQKYDIAIDFMGSPRSALIAFLANIPIRVGFSINHRKFFYNRLVAPSKRRDYTVFHKLALIEKIDIKANDISLFFQDESEPKKNKKCASKTINISISPVSRRVYKRWPLKNFAYVMQQINKGFTVQFHLIAAANEIKVLDQLKTLLHPKINYKIQVFHTLKQTWDYFNKIDYHIGNDNGPRHLAIAKGIPTFAVFGQGYASCWTPPESNLHLYVDNMIECKANCYYPNCKLDCIKAVDPKFCSQKILKHLKQFKHK